MFYNFKRNNISLNIFSGIIFIFLVSCNTYPVITLSKKFLPESIKRIGQNEKSNKKNRFLTYYKQYAINEKSYPPLLLKTNRIFYSRYFANVFSFSPLAEINNSGIEYALKNMYIEAEVLFGEVIKEDTNYSSAYNNLGIIYELWNNYEKAFSMYSKACELEPDNEFYRWNFLYFCDNKKNSIKQQELRTDVNR